MSAPLNHPVDLLQDAVSDRLDAGGRAALDAHLAGCEACRRELAALRWTRAQMMAGESDVALPPELPAGRIVSFPARVRNASGGVWRAQGAAAVSLAYHWLGEDGTRVVWEGLRAPLKADVPPGGEATVTYEIETPRQPGRYRLVFDAVRERIAWFSERRAAAALERTVDVVPAEGR